MHMLKPTLQLAGPQQNVITHNSIRLWFGSLGANGCKGHQMARENASHGDPRLTLIGASNGEAISQGGLRLLRYGHRVPRLEAVGLP
jgi:hypothetical protein